MTLRRDTNKTPDNNAISTSTSGPGKHHIRGIISEIILLSDCFVYCWGVCVFMSPVCHARMTASVHACVHVFRRAWLTTFQLFQHRVSPVKVAGFTRRYSVTDQSGARISWPGSFLSACPPRISLTEVRMWSNGDHTCSLVCDQRNADFKLYMCFYLWRMPTQVSRTQTSRLEIGGLVF